MADGEAREYSIIDAEGNAQTSSRNYTGKATANYPNGDTYTGDFKEGKREGKGDYTYANKAPEDEVITYSGMWLDNCKHGIGKQKYAGVGEYYGYWENGQRHGEGVMTYINKDVYSGNWASGKKDGQGTYIFEKTMEKYVGNFKNGQLMKGKWLYPNGSAFEGNFGFNQPKGVGNWKFANGNVVDGIYTQTKRADVDGDEIKLSWRTTSDISC